jgi:hypothetical protein
MEFRYLRTTVAHMNAIQQKSKKIKTNSVAWIREWIIPTIDRCLSAKLVPTLADGGVSRSQSGDIVTLSKDSRRILDYNRLYWRILQLVTALCTSLSQAEYFPQSRCLLTVSNSGLSLQGCDYLTLPSGFSLCFLHLLAPWLSAVNTRLISEMNYVTGFQLPKWFTKCKPKICYDRRPAGQSVLVSSPVLVPRQDFLLLLTL